MFNASILELENQIQYHQEQCQLATLRLEEAEQELDRVKLASAFAEDATDKVEEALEHIDEKYLSIFKEHLLSLFTTETLVNEEVAPQEIIEEVQQPQTSNIEKIDGEIIYNHVDSICYVAFSAKGRADNYGSYLTRILDIGEKYTVSKTPSMFDSKYELRLEGINFEDALHLQSFKLKRDYDHPDNKQAREVWRTTRKREILPACNPLPRSTPLDEINLGEIVYLNSII